MTTVHDEFRKLCAFEPTSGILVDYLAHTKTDASLRSFLGVENERELLDCLGSDFFYCPGRDISQNEGFLPFYKGRLPPMTETERVCPLGIRWQRGAGNSKFSVDEAINGPFENGFISEADILRHPWPSAKDFDFSPLANEAAANTERIRIGGLWTGIMGDSFRMYGFANFLADIAMQPNIVRTLVNRMTDMYLELNDSYFSALKGNMEVWFFGNDFGSQESLLMSPGMWSDVFSEPIRKLCDLAHSYDLKVMMHSCGSIKPLIPPLIEAGVDILDPIQVTARDMSPADLGAEFGGKIIFHGGIDTQDILVNGSPDEVKEHVRRTTEYLSTGHGYILAPSQIFGLDIPLENILAMYESAKEVNANERQTSWYRSNVDA